jgi:hypothetical protein
MTYVPTHLWKYNEDIININRRKYAKCWTITNKSAGKPMHYNKSFIYMPQTENKNTVSERLWVTFSAQTCEKIYGNLKT